MKPSERMIADEIEKLKTLKPNVLPRSMFGDDHHAAIEAQIMVLLNDMSEDEVYSEFGDPDIDGPSSIIDAAVEAARWLEGESEEDSIADTWKELVR